MSVRILPALPLLLLLAACGYKGALYLPQPSDKNRFGIIQTGLEPGRPVHPDARQFIRSASEPAPQGSETHEQK